MQSEAAKVVGLIQKRAKKQIASRAKLCLFARFLGANLR